LTIYEQDIMIIRRYFLNRG